MAKDEDQGQRGPAESPVAAAVIVLLTLGLSGWGWSRTGTLGALLGALGGIVLGMLGHAAFRASRMHRELQGPTPPSVAALPPEHAMNVLSAMVGSASDGPVLRSPLLDRIKAIRAAAEGDVSGAISEAEDLRSEHPRSAAVHALLAELYRQEARLPASLECAAKAIELAIDGGMNSVAFKVFDGLEPSDAQALELRDTTWARLVGILESRGADAELAKQRADVG